MGIAEVGSSFLDNLFQLDFILLQPFQTIAEQLKDNVDEEDEIKHYHVPAHQQRIGNAELNSFHLRQFAVGQLSLNAEGERAIRQIKEIDVPPVAPGTPLVVIQLIAIEGLA